jgi:hypothetical protein
MVQYKEGTHKRKLLTSETRDIQKRPDLDDKKYLICDDCKHDCITYEPSSDGTCLCECH